MPPNSPWLLIGEQSFKWVLSSSLTSVPSVPAQTRCPHSSAFWISGSDFPALEVQHHICDQDCCGASQPLRAAQDAGRSAQGQQELSIPHHQGRPEACPTAKPCLPQLSGLCCPLLRVHQVSLSGVNPYLSMSFEGRMRPRGRRANMYVHLPQVGLVGKSCSLNTL